MTATLLCLFMSWVVVPQAVAQESKHQEKVDKAHAADIDAAEKAAQSWLDLQDKENYSASWKAASSFFQKQVPESAWVRRMNAVRKPLDPVLTRTLYTADYEKKVPGLPHGDYVALVWETVFSNGHPSLESVVMTAENGAWKMIGYATQ